MPEAITITRLEFNLGKPFTWARVSFQTADKVEERVRMFPEFVSIVEIIQRWVIGESGSEFLTWPEVDEQDACVACGAAVPNLAGVMVLSCPACNATLPIRGPHRDPPAMEAPGEVG